MIYLWYWLVAFTPHTYPYSSPVTAIERYLEIDARIEAVTLSGTSGVRVAERRAERIHVIVGVRWVLCIPTAIVRCTYIITSSKHQLKYDHRPYYVTRLITRLSPSLLHPPSITLHSMFALHIEHYNMWQIIEKNVWKKLYCLTEITNPRWWPTNHNYPHLSSYTCRMGNWECKFNSTLCFLSPAINGISWNTERRNRKQEIHCGDRWPPNNLSNHTPDL